MEHVSRREFGAALSAGFASATLAQRRSAVARFEVLDPEGRPALPEDVERFHLCDALMRPIPTRPRFDNGIVELEPPAGPFRVSVPLVVPGFGHVYVYADKLGEGYVASDFTGSDTRLFPYEAAASRLATVRKLSDTLSSESVAVSTATRERVVASTTALGKARDANEKLERLRFSLESLRESLWAGEELVLARARAAIARRGPRPGFLFGSNGYQFPKLGSAYAERFEELFDYATLPFYRGATEPREGEVSYASAERILEWLSSTSVLVKGHPLIFFYPTVTPEWLRNKTKAEAMRTSVDYVRRTVSRFRHRIHIWDVVNELHDQNELGFTKEELVELTGAALRAARESDPSCFRIVNNCCPWCEYLARDVALGKQSIYDYLKMLEDAEMGYEAIGLQYYYYGRDLLEIERSIETFSGFGKPIHITELGVPSSSADVATEWPHGTRFPWHGERWSESIQADWVEGFYTIAFAKPYVEAVSWWDAVDPAFFPHGGLLREDLTPKESYRRLSSLVSSWRSM